MFQGYGTIVEVVLLRDKATGVRQGIYIELSPSITAIWLVKGYDEWWVSLDAHINICCI